jgi:ribonuclease PH
VGVVRGVAVLDLDYSEDQEAEVDMNVVATASGELVEVQGTGERRSFRRAELDALLELALGGIARLVALQQESLAPLLAEVQAVQSRTSPRRDAKREKDLWGPPG